MRAICGSPERHRNEIASTVVDGRTALKRLLADVQTRQVVELRDNQNVQWLSGKTDRRRYVAFVARRCH